MDSIKETDPTIREVSPIHLTGRADISATRVTFHIRIDGHLILPCSRTLVDVKYPIDVETTETFMLNSHDYEADEEVHQVTGDVIDLEPIIKEILLVEIPMQVFSDDSAGQEGAPQSGKDWEVIEEQEKSEKLDPRLAGLAKFFEDSKDSSD
ncbi:COG1399 protein in cluster with ribosomal protein L32p, firmicutes subfamily [Mesobacillus selenatarsenatis SF-1]|uniref:COG1399 protein in cluster with ribosomal protein L32p, firmicutes subfamily n=2 Tax=Bacillales TaxID=1385 RepID=A0A0A8X6B8_MESS1|nr:COG1399 protein in cluster with ribosomal protein L32p, firmicutes subfamily [Mesobacillus selenatarsenatis SF-1]